MKRLIENTQASFKEKKSLFIAYGFAVKTQEEAREKIGEIKKLHPKATHVCSAMIVGSQKPVGIFDDDGEPALTAGAPILQIMESNQLVNTIFLVVRYFGGIKLGKGGLIRAYSQGARLALENSVFEEIFQREKLVLTLDYSQYGSVEYYISKENLFTGENTFDEKVTQTLYLTQQELTRFKSYLEENIQQMVKMENLGNQYIVKSKKKGCYKEIWT